MANVELGIVFDELYDEIKSKFSSRLCDGCLYLGKSSDVCEDCTMEKLGDDIVFTNFVEKD